MLFYPCGGRKTDKWPQHTVAAYGPTVPAPDGQQMWRNSKYVHNWQGK
jgi:hypothetical protein